MSVKLGVDVEFVTDPENVELFVKLNDVTLPEPAPVVCHKREPLEKERNTFPVDVYPDSVLRKGSRQVVEALQKFTRSLD